MYAEIDISRVKRDIEEIRKSESVLRKQYYELDSTIAGLRQIDDDSMQITCNKLKKQKSSLYAEIRKVQSLRVTLEQVINLYCKTDQRIKESNSGICGVKLIPMNIHLALLDSYAKVLDDSGIKFE